jgi:hypothetical protein
MGQTGEGEGEENGDKAGLAALSRAPPIGGAQLGWARLSALPSSSMATAVAYSCRLLGEDARRCAALLLRGGATALAEEKAWPAPTRTAAEATGRRRRAATVKSRGT